MIELFYVIFGITGLVLLLFFFESYDNYIVEEDYDYSTGSVFVNNSTGELILIYSLDNTTNIQGRYNNKDTYTFLGGL